MSKQSNANSIYENGLPIGATRKQTIAKIVTDLGVSAGYASTLYNNARKASQAGAVPTLIEQITAPASDAELDQSKITSFNSRNIDTIQNEVKAALDAVLAKHGMSASFGNIRYNSGDYSSRMTISVGNADDAAKQKFARDAYRVGLKAEDFGKEFTTHSGKTFTITGINLGRRKYPISGVSPRGARYKFSAEQVKRGLK